MTTKTIYISNGINESHYVMTADESFGVMVHSGGALRFHAPPEKVIEILNAIEGLAVSTAAPNTKEGPGLVDNTRECVDSEEGKRLARDLNSLTHEELLYVVLLLSKRTAEMLKSML